MMRNDKYILDGKTPVALAGSGARRPLSHTLEDDMTEATPRPWFADQTNWRNEPVEHDWYIHGNVHEPFDEESDDPELNTGSCTSVAIVVGNPTAGGITQANAALIVRAVNRDDLLDELVAACNPLAAAVRAFLKADRQEHLRTRFSDDENDKFDAIVAALGPANAALAKATTTQEQT